MAAADIIGGTTGAVSSPSGFNCDVTDWSATIAADNESWRPLSAEGKKSGLTGYQVSGTFAGTVQSNAAGTNPAPTGAVSLTNWAGSFTLTAQTGCTLTFTGHITQVGLARSAGRLIGTYNFISNGTVTVTWDTTT